MIIAFTSDVKEAGKNTAADFVKEYCKEHDIPYLQEAFSDRMKLLVAESLGTIETTGDNKSDYVKEDVIAYVDQFKLRGGIEVVHPTKYTHSWIGGRDFIINLAEGARSLFGSEFWIKQVFKDPQVMKVAATGIVTITDLSYDIEADHVHRYQSAVWKIVRPNSSGSRLRPGLGLSPTKVDNEIWNTGTLDEFRDAIQALVDIKLRQIRKRKFER